MSDTSEEKVDDLQSNSGSASDRAIADEYAAHDFGAVSDLSSASSAGILGSVGPSFDDDDTRHLRVTPGWIAVDEQNKQKYVNVPIWVGKEDGKGNLVFRGDGLIECMEPINRVPVNFNLGGPYFVEDTMFNVGAQNVKAFGSGIAETIKRGEKSVQNFDTNYGRATFNAAAKYMSPSITEKINVSDNLTNAISAVDISDNSLALLNSKTNLVRFEGAHVFRMTSANSPREYVGKYLNKTAIPNGVKWSFTYNKVTGSKTITMTNEILAGTGVWPKFFVVIDYDKNAQGGGKSRRFRKRVKTRKYGKRGKRGTMHLAKKRTNKRTRRA